MSSKTKAITTLDQKLMHTMLQEINHHQNQGLPPMHNEHLNHLCEAEEVLEYLLHLKSQGLVSGNLVRRGVTQTPYRIVNIRLTYVGMMALRAKSD
ncbi:MAG: hypothetical protein AB1757_30225 [Acidobacteriota bacterium]